jgi:hypothetical protein
MHEMAVKRTDQTQRECPARTYRRPVEVGGMSTSNARINSSYFSEVSRSLCSKRMVMHIMLVRFHIDVVLVAQSALARLQGAGVVRWNCRGAVGQRPV